MKDNKKIIGPVSFLFVVFFSVGVSAGKAKPIMLLDPELSQWEVWMGVPHESVKGLPEGTYQSDDVHRGTAMGLNNDPKKVFTTYQENNETILRISGEIYGGLSSLKSYKNYHLQMQVKWGEKKWPPRENGKRDSGLLYHCQGDHGAFWQVWKACLEYQIQEKDFGDLIPLAGPSAMYRGGKDGKRSIFDVNAKDYIPAKGYIHAVLEPDYAHGEWNTVDLYVYQDKAIHAVNGVVVFAIKNAIDGDKNPLTSGQIQLQSEAAEIYYKNIKLTPIKGLPKKLVKVSRLK